MRLISFIRAMAGLRPDRLSLPTGSRSKLGRRGLPGARQRHKLRYPQPAHRPDRLDWGLGRARSGDCSRSVAGNQILQSMCSRNPTSSLPELRDFKSLSTLRILHARVAKFAHHDAHERALGSSLAGDLSPLKNGSDTEFDNLGCRWHANVGSLPAQRPYLIGFSSSRPRLRRHHLHQPEMPSCRLVTSDKSVRMDFPTRAS